MVNTTKTSTSNYIRNNCEIFSKPAYTESNLLKLMQIDKQRLVGLVLDGLALRAYEKYENSGKIGLPSDHPPDAADLQSLDEIENMMDISYLEGVLFPNTNLYNGRRYYRSDRQIEYFYNAGISTWLSTQTYQLTLTPRLSMPSPQSTLGFDASFNHDYAIFPISVNGWFYPVVAQSGVNYYTTKLSIYDATSGTDAGSYTAALIGTTNTKSFTLGNTRNYAMDMVMSSMGTVSATHYLAVVRLTPTNNPGAIYAGFTFSYRLVG